MYKFGIVGCGMIASIHADAIKKIDNAVLYAVADNNKENAKAFAQRENVIAYESFEKLLDDSEIDVVCICTPSCFHAQNAIDAMKKGKHVVVEKPLAFTKAEAKRVLKTSKKTGKMVSVISQLRYTNDVKKLKALVDDGAFGKLTLCSLNMKYYRSKEYYASSPWKGKKKFDGGGALMNQGIHGIDLMQYIMGDVKEVKGKIRTLCHKIEVEDTAVAIVEFNCGALGVIEASSCAYPGFERRIEIHGETGYAVLKEGAIEKLMIDKKEVSLNGDLFASGSASDPTAMDSDLHAEQIKNLINAIGGREKLLVDCVEGAKAVEIIEKIYKQ